MTLTRPETPAHMPLGDSYFAGVVASVDLATGAKRCFEAKNCRGGVFSVKNTSARACEPSATSWSAMVSSSSKRTLTWMPVFFSNALTNAWVVCTC